MSFLDNLESNLKSLETQEESQQSADQLRRSRERERANVQAAAPYAEALRKGPYTAELFKQAARIGFSMRVKVHIAWLGTTLRLEARDRRLELRPTPGGVLAVYLENNHEIRTESLDLKKGNPETLVREWLAAE
jgi:hypothetical protein